MRPLADMQTLEALIHNRYELIASYARGTRLALRDELLALRARQADTRMIQAARRWLHRDPDKLPVPLAEQLALARAASPVLDKMVVMREELRQMWLNRNHTREQLAADLQAWCQQAQASGIAALQEFSMRLRSVRA